MQPSDPTPAAPLPAPDPMSEVVGRVTKYLDNVRAFVKRDDGISEMLDEPGYFATLDHGDLRALLAAYQSVREDTARLDWIDETGGFRLGAVSVLSREAIDIARRTGGTE